MAEKESKFVLSMASAVHALINVAERQQAIVDAALKETREAARQTSEAARLSRKAADELPLQVIVALDRVSEGTATRAATLLAEKFTQADTQAYQAAQGAAKTVTAPRHVDRKVGRNDPCPCGSGKKYKRCCGA